MNDNDLIAPITQAVIDGESTTAIAATLAALEAGLDPLQILNEGLMCGADEVGKRFESGDFFLPELMLAGRALESCHGSPQPIVSREKPFQLGPGQWQGGHRHHSDRHP